MCEKVQEQKEPTYQDKKRALMESLLASYDYEGWSQRPNTFVRVKFHRPSGETITELGWAKVSSGDNWDINEGVRVAISKAAARVAKLQLLSPNKLDKIYPPLKPATRIAGNLCVKRIVVPVAITS